MYPTVSPDSNLLMVVYIAEYFEALGAWVALYLDSSGAKANLLARLGPQTDGGVVLLRHTDVAPATK